MYYYTVTYLKVCEVFDVKKFSIVTAFKEDETEEVFYEGFTEMDELTELDEFLDILLSVPSNKMMDVEIENCILMDSPCVDGERVNIDNIDDIGETELTKLIRDFENLLNKGFIYCEDVISFKINGIGHDDTEYIDTATNL